MDTSSPKASVANAFNKELDKLMKDDPNVVVGGQLIKYGVAGLTTGLWEKYKDRFITYSVSESLMNSSAMGLALAGKHVVMIHVRIDFLASGMCALVNHIPIWYKKGINLPITIVCQVGKGMGQGAQHSKDLSPWFIGFEGWNVVIPNSPQDAAGQLRNSVRGSKPTLYVLHRELFDQEDQVDLPTPSNQIKLCGASQTHEKEFYGNRFISARSKLKLPEQDQHSELKL